MDALRMEDLLDESLVMTDVSAKDREELLTKMVHFAYDRGYVRETYLEAVLERERMYPTGLPTPILKIALPHTTEKTHVAKSAIIIAKLREPVDFKEMGEGEADIPVEMVFMLAVTGSKSQLGVLQKIVGMFTNQNALQELKAAQTPREIIASIHHNLDSE